MTLYFQLLLFTISFPLIASWDKRFNYASKFKFLFPALFLTGTFFIVWDIIFTKNGVWGFSEIHTTNINFLYLPIEEWLFFIIIPFFCLLTVLIIDIDASIFVIGYYLFDDNLFVLCLCICYVITEVK